MKHWFVIINLICSLSVKLYCQERKAAQEDSAGNIIVKKNLGVANRGICPIPGASFDGPVINAGVSLTFKRFSYSPDFSFGMNGKPWLANNNFRFLLQETKKIM